MSGYMYVTPDAVNLLAVPGALLYVYDADGLFPLRVVEGRADEPGGCAIVLPTDSVARHEHPEGAYNLSYPYTRTSIRFWLTDPDPLDEVAQLTPLSRFLAVLIKIVDADGRPLAAKTVKVTVGPAQLFPCAADIYDYFDPATVYLLVDSQYLSLPARVTLDVTDVNLRRRVGWLGLRRARDGAPSGSVL